MNKIISANRALLIAACIALVLGLGTVVQSQPDPATREVMKRKLQFAQGVLEGITTGNFDLIAAQAVSLRKLSGTGEWAYRTTEEYQMFTQDYRRHCQALEAAAKKKNLDAAAVAYFQLTMSCLNCHQYLRDSRLAFRHSAEPSDALLARLAPPLN